MPFINIKMTAGATKDQKAQIVKEFTETLVRVLGKNPQNTHIVIDEVARENWGMAGQLVSDRPAAPPKG
jgi:4-oxalocrotonate tautomerase